ncbi:FAD-binding oxidoreductase [Jannaschia sp. M317]|uniref:NAD(P)/FAD-dependent oxidoreductase n=1 Tax=Jannaschia sp. M317 TaxID=2867011 RepID=UPI0021A6CDAE|nr:FAD-binding oxidoreductase [Jannaschia sp. M317]UWQ18970.1 FAD-binding oxidoreductase [Jannaschia sp. M317]
MAIDVTVLGAGAFGLSCAWALIRRGARVRVIDPAGVGTGSSGGIVGALAPHVPEQWNDKKAFQLDSLLMAEDWWRAVADAGGGDPGYARSGRLQPIPDAAALLRAQDRAAGARLLWPSGILWDVIDAPDDWSPPSPTGRVIRDTLSARLHPARACAALAAAIRAQGSEIVVDGTTEGLVLHATGWQGLASMQDDRGRAAGNGVKGQAVLLDLDRRDLPQLYADGLHIVPHADGTTAIGSTSERDFDDPTATDAQLDAVLARAVAAVPTLAGCRVLRRWAGVRPRARSRAPLMGAWPGRAGHFIANGGFKIGFGVAPKVAEVMADLVLTGSDTIPEAFRTDTLARWSARG